MNAMGAAFQDLRVIELGQIHNGPYCGLLLARLGADVIKVEPPDGERLRYRSTDDVETHEFLMLNSDKRSVVVDLKTPEGLEVMLTLVDTADVVIKILPRAAWSASASAPTFYSSGTPA